MYSKAKKWKNGLKKDVLIILFSMFYIFGMAQQKTVYFSNDPSKTVEEMNTFFGTANKQHEEIAKATTKKFAPFWATLSPQLQKSFITLANDMLNRRHRPVPQFSDFIKTYQAIAEHNFDDMEFEVLIRCLKYDIAADLNAFGNQMDFYYNLLTENKLNKISGCSWYARDVEDYVFAFDSLPKVIFPSFTLVCTNEKDSMVIEETTGTYYPTKNQLMGNKGKILWEKAGLDNDVYATFDKYIVSTKLTRLQIENAKYSNPAYFPKAETGVLEDRITVADDIDGNSTFPRFTSYRKNIHIENFYEGVDYEGGMQVRGASVFGKGEGDSLAVLIFKRDGTPAIVVSSNSFILKPEAVYSEMCSMCIRLGNGDSMFHSAISMRYDAPKRDIWFIRGDKGPQRMPITDSYHQLEITSGAIHWNMKEEKIDISAPPGPTDASFAVLESANYFEQNRVNKMQGMSEINPMWTLYEFFRKTKVKKAPLADIVKWYGYSRSDVQSLMFSFVEYGFIDYNVNNDVITYRQKLGNYLQNELKKKDYDVIEFRSSVQGNATNATLSLLNYDLDIFGIDMVIVSDSQMVTIFPTNKHITVQKNRDFLFHGKVEAGLFDFWVTNSRFDYDHFLMDFNVIDSIVFYVEDKSQQPNMYGEYPLQKVRNYVEDVSGTLYIDEQNNKSSMFSKRGYPYFESKSNGRVTYNHDFVQKGVYDKNRFYYSTEKFTLRDLDDFDTDSLSFDGYLNSGGIFPDIALPLKVRPDFSLGFVHNTDASGLPAYEGKGVFAGKIDLSNQGLRCTGGLDFVASHAQGKNMLFFLDSMNAKFDDYRIDARAEFPPTTARNLNAHWDIYSNQMFVNNTDSKIKMYDRSRMDGQLIVSNSGVKGNGIFTHDIGEFVSDEYRFLHHEVTSNITSIALKDTILEDFYLKTQNHNMHLNLAEQWGKFESNSGANPIIFPLNEYMTYSLRFEWKIPQAILSFMYDDPFANININGSELKELYDMKSVGNELISIHPAQDSLRFTTTKADYNLKKYELLAHGVRFIETADAAIFPRDGEVKIFRRAEMGKLANSRILANTYTKYHEITKAITYINSRKSYHANGYFNYVDENKKKQEIYFDTIWVTKDVVTRASGNIDYMADFTLNPYFGFAGKALLQAEEKFLTFKGAVSLKQTCYENVYAPVRFEGVVNPDSILIPINATTKDTSNRPVVAAIASNSEGTIYPAFARSKDALNNSEYLSASGLLTYDKELSSFVVTSAKKLEDPDTEENAIYLNTKRCQVKGVGVLNLGANFGRVAFNPMGQITNFIANDSAVIRFASPFDFVFSKACMDIILDKLATNMSLDALDPSENAHYKSVLYSLLGQKEFDKLYPELKNNYRFLKLPKSLSMNMLFADLQMEWQSDKKAFVNTAPIGIAIVGGSEVNRYVPGILEIEKKGTSKTSNKTNLKLYLEIGDDWFYFQFDGTNMNACSSIKAFETTLKAIDIKDRTIAADTKKKLPMYRYGAASVSQKRKFVEKYRTEE
jgi:hypothetical protein